MPKTRVKKAYHSTRWRKLRLRILRQEPLCRACKTRYAEVIDHINPVDTAKEPDEGFFNEDNLQPLCPGCHRLKTLNDRPNRNFVAPDGTSLHPDSPLYEHDAARRRRLGLK